MNFFQKNKFIILIYNGFIKNIIINFILVFEKLKYILDYYKAVYILIS